MELKTDMQLASHVASSIQGYAPEVPIDLEEQPHCWVIQIHPVPERKFIGMQIHCVRQDID